MYKNGKEKLGVKTILGVSNISFGVPNRSALKYAYLNLALYEGLDLPIINPNEEGVMETINAFKVINNIDKGCIKYIERYSGYKDNNVLKINSKNNEELPLEYIVEHGLKEHAKDTTLDL